jgi:hypothetical protein
LIKGLPHRTPGKALDRSWGLRASVAVGAAFRAVRGGGASAAADRPLRHALQACGVGAGPSGRADRAAGQWHTAGHDL